MSEISLTVQSYVTYTLKDHDIVTVEFMPTDFDIDFLLDVFEDGVLVTDDPAWREKKREITKIIHGVLQNSGLSEFTFSVKGPSVRS